MHTDDDQHRRLRDGPMLGEQPGGLGLMVVDIAAGAPTAVLQRAQAAMGAHLRGTALDSDLDFDADWALWSLQLGGGGLRLELALCGFPVSGFSGLRRFFLRMGAASVTQRSRGGADR